MLIDGDFSSLSKGSSEEFAFISELKLSRVSRTLEAFDEFPLFFNLLLTFLFPSTT